MIESYSHGVDARSPSIAAGSQGSAAEIETLGVWFGPSDRPLAGWLTHGLSGPTGSAIVVAPPTGYTYWCAHRALRLLAEALARAGHEVLRIDYDGCGDSAGDQWESDRVAAWRASVAHGVAALRERGATQVTLVGARLGATIALLDAAELSADRVIAWLPPARARRYAKEIRLLGTQVPVTCEPGGRRDTLVHAGSVFSADTVREIGGLTLTDLDGPPAAEVLVVDDPSGSSTEAVSSLRDLGTSVEHLVADEAEDALETPPEYATEPDRVAAPFRLVNAIAEWVGPAAPAIGAHGCATARWPAEASIPWRTGAVHERFERLGPQRHMAVFTEPDDVDPDAALLVLLNPGSETHVGPGRAWVEFARSLAVAGRRTVRVDFVGWGESPGTSDRPGRPYDAACVADALSIVDALRDAGHRRIVLAGLCASAWIALDAARVSELDGVVAINPQMYWSQGDPVEIDWDRIRAERADEIRHIELGARAHLWDVMDAVNLRGRAGQWLDELAAGPGRVELLFTEGDDGLVFLERRCGRRLNQLRDADRIGVHEVAEIDHPMHHTWLRGHVAGALEAALDRIDVALNARDASRELLSA